jgi:DNA-binding transcriptional ArsR family regulator
MFRKTVLFVLVATISLAMVPPSNAASTPYSGDLTIQPVTTKALGGDNGTVYMLWTIHSLLSGIQPGIWYAKYEPNGTAVIPPSILRNSTTIQSADMAEDKSGNLHLVWSEGPAFTNSTSSLLTTLSDARLYYAEVNATNNELTSPTPLTGYGKIVMWPAIALDNESVPHVVWMEESINTENRTLSEYYGAIENGHLADPLLLARYVNQSFLDVPRPQIIYDQAYSSFHVAWTYSQQNQDSIVNSEVRYASVNFDGNATHRIAVAELREPIQDASIAQGGNGSAYVVWQGQASDSSRSVYVSRISNEGRIVFLHSFTEPSTSSPYLVASSDSQENLFLVWYQPPPLPQRVVSARSVTSVSYVRIDNAGLVTDSGNELISGTVLAIRVSTTGDVYALSSLGIIRVKTPVLTPLIQLVLGIVAFSAMGIALTDEGKYRLARSLTSITQKAHSTEPLPQSSNAILHLLTLKPGCDLSEIKRSARNSTATVSLSGLTRLERAGYVSSVRVGLSRRFFDSNPADQIATPKRIASMILNEVKRTPGTWEGKLAQDLGLSQQIVHYHVKRMRSEGLLDVESQGRRKLYRLAHSGARN